MSQQYSTYKDVIDLIPQLYEETEDSADSIAINTVYPILNTQRMNNYIRGNDGKIRANLIKVYGTNLTVTPTYTIPEPNFNNVGSQEFNFLNASGAQLNLNATTTKTDVISINFTNDSGAFSVTSQLYGNQGTGDTATTFTATNSCIQFDSTFWSGSGAKTNDRFYIKTYNVDQILVDISSMLAAAQILNSVYTESIPNRSMTSGSYKKQAMESLTQLRDMDIYLSKDINSINLDPIQVDYEIDDLGNDVTNYADAEWNRRKQTDYIS